MRDLRARHAPAGDAPHPVLSVCTLRELYRSLDRPQAWERVVRDVDARSSVPPSCCKESARTCHASLTGAVARRSERRKATLLSSINFVEFSTGRGRRLPLAGSRSGVGGGRLVAPPAMAVISRSRERRQQPDGRRQGPVTRRGERTERHLMTTLGIAGRTHVTRLGDAQIVAQRPGSWQPESGQRGSVVNHPKSQPGHTTTSSLAGIAPVNAGPASPAKTTTRFVPVSKIPRGS
jgi:hypothetical protein